MQIYTDWNGPIPFNRTLRICKLRSRLGMKSAASITGLHLGYTSESSTHRADSTFYQKRPCAIYRMKIARAIAGSVLLSGIRLLHVGGIEPWKSWLC